jgi:hypothetical protein
VLKAAADHGPAPLRTHHVSAPGHERPWLLGWANSAHMAVDRMPVQAGRCKHYASAPLPESTHEALILFYLFSDIFKSTASSKI